MEQALTTQPSTAIQSPSPNAALFDLAAFDLVGHAEKGAWLTLSHPITGDPLPLRIFLLGQDSKTFKQAVDTDINHKLAQQKRTGEQPDIDAKAARKRGYKFLAAITKQWQTFDGKEWQDGFLFGGKILRCTEDIAYQLYAHPQGEWIAEQVDEFTGKRKNFNPDLPDEEPSLPSAFDAFAQVADVEGK
jgi:hypothetical protein